MSFNDAERVALEAGAPRLGLFVRLETDPITRLWLGVGAIEPGINQLDPTDGEQYRGFGEIVDLPAFQQLSDGTAERVEFSLNGIPGAVFGDIASAISDQQIKIAGKPISAGYALFGNRWQMLGPVHWTWDGVADFLRVEKPVVDGAEAPETWNMRLSAGAWLTGRRRPGRSYFVQSDQAARSAETNPSAPVDRFCERTPRYTDDTDKTWPHFPT